MKKVISTLVFILLFSNQNILANGYVASNLSPAELQELMITTGCDKEIAPFFDNMFNQRPGGYKFTKPSEKCLHLMEGRIKK